MCRVAPYYGVLDWNAYPDTGAAIAFTRWLRGVDAAVALLAKVDGAGRVQSPRLDVSTLPGPNLRANGRAQAMRRPLGRPQVISAATEP